MPLDEALIARALKGETVADQEIHITRQDGSGCIVSMSAAPIRRDDRRILGAVVAVIYANIARELKRILAWSSVENIGLAFTMFGFQLLLRRGGWSALADLALAAMFLHLFAHALFKTGLFLGAGAVMHGTHTGKIELLGGLASRMPWLSAGALVLALSAAALPPAGTFVAELVLLQSVMGTFGTHDAGAIAAALTVLVGVAVLALAFFAVPTRVHERYLFPLFGLAGILNWRALVVQKLTLDSASWPYLESVPVAMVVGTVAIV